MEFKRRAKPNCCLGSTVMAPSKILVCNLLNLQVNNSRKFSDKKLPRLCLGHCCIQKCYEKDRQTHVKKLQQQESYFFVCKGCNTWVPLRHSSHFLMSSLGLAQNQGIATQTISVSEIVQGSASNINTEQV